MAFLQRNSQLCGILHEQLSELEDDSILPTISKGFLSLLRGDFEEALEVFSGDLWGICRAHSSLTINGSAMAHIGMSEYDKAQVLCEQWLRDKELMDVEEPKSHDFSYMDKGIVMNLCIAYAALDTNKL